MFLSRESKEIATRIGTASSMIRGQIALAVEQSVVGRDEVPFITALTQNLPLFLDNALAGVALAAHTRTTKIHQKPRVRYQNSLGATVSCELGDLLFVVKYYLPGGKLEAKSVIHQAKSSVYVGDPRCNIDPTQLELIREWPGFEFGRVAAGGPQIYKPVPWTLEFGSYMLMRRRPNQGDHLAAFRRDYGVVPSAWRVHDAGPGVVDIVTIPFTLLAATGLFNHVAFMNGEPHANPTVKNLVEALYRFVDWAPDPPGEFDGYYNDYTNQPDEGGFAVIEVNIALIDSAEAEIIRRLASQSKKPR